MGGRLHARRCKEETCMALCRNSVSLMKEYNIRRHCETSPKHTDKETYKNMDMEENLRKVEELKRSLKPPVGCVHQRKKTKRGYCQGQFYCGWRGCEITPSLYQGRICESLHAKRLWCRVPSERQLFSNVNLSRITWKNMAKKDINEKNEFCEVDVDPETTRFWNAP